MLPEGGGLSGVTSVWEEAEEMLKNCIYPSNLHRSGFPQQHPPTQLLRCCWTPNKDRGGAPDPVGHVDSVSPRPGGFLSVRRVGHVLWGRKPTAPKRSCSVLPEWR